MDARTVISIAFDDDRPEVAIRIWQITREEAENLAAHFTSWWGEPINAMASREALEPLDTHPGIVTDET